ncbi:hypothetical protein [Chitiniphilus eburneus]|uniref:Peptidase M48 domain-containing protein n=1 Tax=Chitiniphilus eburneus TaxID=2571148 RepID=A0A4U0PJ64_9NEIS|nr:hypothetical protein [Chitiniphilus eburneus]TJZ67975.1 hypothetical protein FAZ21_15855 [Chitiniphilus eburneus]
MNEQPILDPQRVAALENDAHANPTLYQLRVTAMALAGYLAVVGLVLFGLLIFFIGVHTERVLLTISGIAFAVTSVYLVLNCLTQNDDLPTGRPLHRAEAPDLFRLLDKLARKTGTAVPDSVSVGERFAVELVEQPTRLPLQRRRRHLIVGLPLLLALSSSELAALLAQECGRLHGDQGRLATWICQLRRRWAARYPHLHDEHGALSEFVARFYLWYIPRFQTYTLALARQQEMAATQWSAEVIGTQAAAHAAIKMALFGRFFEHHYWTAYWRQADTRAEPGLAPYAGMAEGFRQGERVWRSSRWLKEALAERPSYDDPHPSLKQQLDRLGQAASPVGWPRQSAGEKWLGVTLGKLVGEFDRDWLALNSQTWKTRYRTARQEEAELETLRMHSPDTLDSHQLWRLAQLSHSRLGAAETRPLLERVLAQQPEHAQARYLLASLLLDAGDERGLGCMEQAMKLDQQLVDDGMARCQRYLGKRARQHDVEDMWARLSTYHGWAHA